ncbi:MAG: M4 family metallopeptidase [Bacteroidota bacterium]
MYHRNLVLLIILLASTSLVAQKPILAPVPAHPEAYDIEELANGLNLEALPSVHESREAEEFTPRTLVAPFTLTDERVERWKAQPHAQTGLPDWVELWGENLRKGDLESQIEAWLAILSKSWGIEKPKESIRLLKQRTTKNGTVHFSFQQQQDGIPVYGNELKAHAKNGQLYLMNGRMLPTPGIATTPTIAEEAAIDMAKEAIAAHDHFRELSEAELMQAEQVQTQLVIFYPDNDFSKPRLAWSIQLLPHLASRWQLMIDAQDGKILRQLDHICHLLPPNGPQIANATDLQGISRTVHSYRWNGQNYLIDASREMFDNFNSNFPNEPQGAIWTIDANNTAPQNNDFTTFHNTSPGNFWNDATAVSAHYNSGQVYEYFKNTFDRNSINDAGGNIISIINVANPNGSSMGNAFWNGFQMFYGNGDADFSSPLAKALDVAGHEISHGVIQNTANLEYQGESGALNESFADIFGAMIDREDWQMGEDVVNTSTFSSGALRDLSNPNNGGNGLGDPGWQPAHTNEQYFGSLDNGGVHINSGIPNRAFFLFATDVGRSTAEQVFYLALTDYLTRTSNFLDLRAAVNAAALEMFNQSIANAAIDAFNTVGIGSGGGGGTVSNSQVDLPVNPGDELILFTEGNNNNLYLNTPTGEVVSDPLTNLDPYSKPSITDDGSVIVFVAQDRTLRSVVIDWSTNQILGENTLSSSPIWRNVAISRDGNRLAALTDENDNRLLVFDLSTTDAPSQDFFLINPTFTEGVSTGDVRYADVLEFDHSGEFVMYDALNEIQNQNGTTISYWDIGFIRIWNRSNDNFGDGSINKLFTGLPENTSVGNPTFAKNSPYIIAFDFIDGNTESYFLLAANIETGDTGELFENGRLNYPNYSNQDDQIIFDAGDTSGNDVIGSVEVNTDKITPADDPFVLLPNGFSGARWGVWFANGQRQLVNNEEITNTASWASVWPTLSSGGFQLSLNLPTAALVQLDVVDLMGKSLHAEQLQLPAGAHQNNLQLDLPAGAYVLRLQSDEQSFSQRIIVAK